MKKSYFLWSLLVISVALNAYCFINCNKMSIKNTQLTTSVSNLSNPLNLAPLLQPGFDPTLRIIPDADSLEIIQAFKSMRSNGETINGGIISLSVIDALRNIDGCNGISYRFARQTANHQYGLQDPNGLFIILQGVKVDYESGTRRIQRITSVSSPTYYGGYWCPTHCLPFN